MNRVLREAEGRGRPRQECAGAKAGKKHAWFGECREVRLAWGPCWERGLGGKSEKEPVSETM